MQLCHRSVLLNHKTPQRILRIKEWLLFSERRNIWLFIIWHCTCEFVCVSIMFEKDFPRKNGAVLAIDKNTMFNIFVEVFPHFSFASFLNFVDNQYLNCIIFLEFLTIWSKYNEFLTKIWHISKNIVRIPEWYFIFSVKIWTDHRKYIMHLY